MTKTIVKQTLKFRIIKTGFIIMAVFGLWLFIYAQKMDSKPEVDRVAYLNEFYTNSWYTQQWEYKKDIEDLKRIKQEALDKLNYGASAIFFQNGIYDPEYMTQEQIERFQLIDNVIRKANEWIKNIKEPDYTQINQASPVATKATKEAKQAMDFINLLK